MSDRYGKNYRTFVADTNAGKVIPEGGAQAPQRKDQSLGTGPVFKVGDQSGVDPMVEALVKAGGVVGSKLAQDADNAAEMQGYIDAGTEEGAAVVKENKSIIESIFGASPTRRGAQKRVLDTQTDEMYTQLQKDIKSGSETLTREEWDEHTQGYVDAQMEGHNDPEMKSLMTKSMGNHLRNINREWEKANSLHIAEVNRSSVIDGVVSKSTLLESALASGDHDIIMDAMEGAKKALELPDGMHKDAFGSALTASMVDNLTQGKGAMFEAAVSTGVLQKYVTAEQRLTLRDAYNIFQSQTNRDQLEAKADIGLYEQEGRVDEVEQLATNLQRVNPELFPNGIGPHMTRAITRRQEIQAAEERKRQRASQYLSGDPSFSSHSAADRAEAADYALDDMANRALTKIYQEQGLNVPTNFAPNEILDWQTDNVDRWGQQWAKSKTPSKQVGRMQTEVLALIRKEGEAFTAEDSDKVQTGLSSMQRLRQFAPEQFAKQFGTDADLLEFEQMYQSVVVNGQDPIAAKAEIAMMRARASTGQTIDALPTEELLVPASEIAKSLIAERGASAGIMGHLVGAADAVVSLIPGGLSPSEAWERHTSLRPENAAVLEKRAAELYQQEYMKTGNKKHAMESAKVLLQRSGTIIGQNFVHGLRETEANSYGGDVDRYIEGIEADEDWQMKLTAENNFRTPLDLRGDDVFIVPEPGGKFFTVQQTKGQNGMPAVYRFAVPTRREHILPTNAEQRTDAIVETAGKILGPAAKWLNSGHVMEDLKAADDELSEKARGLTFSEKYRKNIADRQKLN